MSKVSESILQPTAAMLVIGNEILSGRTQDTNTNFLAKKLTTLGINLCEVRVVADLREEIIFAVNSLRTKYEYVFTSGGIGPTHDDITADAISAAFDVRLSVRKDAKKILEKYYSDNGNTLNEARLRMARIPVGATLIENSISKAPGFCLQNVYVMAGVPSIFKVMVEWILPKLIFGQPLLSLSITCLKPEGEIAKNLEALATKFPSSSIGSYPFIHDGILGTTIVARHFDESVLKCIEEELKLIC